MGGLGESRPATTGESQESIVAEDLVLPQDLVNDLPRTGGEQRAARAGPRLEGLAWQVVAACAGHVAADVAQVVRLERVASPGEVTWTER